MDFSLTDEQLALRDAAARFCEATWPAASRGLPETAPQQAERHRAMAGLGLLGLALPDACGGSALGATEAMLVAQELGRVLAGSSWLASHTLAGQLIAQSGTPQQQTHWLPALVAGELPAALACSEAQARHTLHDVQTRATRTLDNRGWRISGHKAGVLGGDTAQLLIVCARTAGDPTDPEGLSLFAVPHTAEGLRVQPHVHIDGRAAAHLHLQHVVVGDDDLIGPLDGALPLLQAAAARAEAALCAESAGAAEALLRQTCEHLKTRRQFGQPLARFQALQHRLADMAIALEQIESMACVAALACESPDPATRDHQVSAARCLTSQLSRKLALEAIQLHGAMGMTDECRASRLAKRLIANGLLFGDASHHLRRFAAP